jgi:hypothetical protein
VIASVDVMRMLLLVSDRYRAAAKRRRDEAIGQERRGT